MGFGLAGNDVSQGGFAATWRPPQDKRGQGVGLDHAPQDMPFTNQVILAGEFGDRAGAHALSQRRIF